MKNLSNYSFSPEIRDVLAQAVRESDILRHDHLGTGHILLAVLAEEGGPAASILDALHADRESIRSHVMATLQPGSAPYPYGERPYTARARKVLETAMASADEFGEVTVDVDHLLIGLVSVGEEEAAGILAQAGVTRELVIQEARRRRQ